MGRSHRNKDVDRMLTERKFMQKRCAEIEKNEESVRVGPDVNLADQRGMTPLHAAGMRSGSEIVDMLCGCKGIKVNPKDCQGRTPLMIACMTGNEDAVRSLVNQPEIDLHCVDDQGRSLDFYARGNKKIHLLLKNARRNPTEAQQFHRIKEVLKEEAGLVKEKNLEKRIKKEKGKVYKAEKVDNYQGDKDIDTILENLEKPTARKEKKAGFNDDNKEKRKAKTDDPLDSRNYDYKYEHGNLRVFSDSKLDQNNPQVQQFLSSVAQTIKEQEQMRDQQQEEQDPNSFNIATYDSNIGTTHYKVSMTISPVDDGDESSDDDTWGPLTKAIADYKREGRVITKEMQETLNCECCIKERQEKMRKKLEAGMKINKSPSVRQKMRDQRKFQQLMSILNGAITDTNHDDVSKKLTFEELKDIENMTDESFKKISESVEKQYLEDLSNKHKGEAEDTKGQEDEHQKALEHEEATNIPLEKNKADEMLPDAKKSGIYEIPSNDVDESQMKSPTNEDKPLVKRCGNTECAAEEGKLHRCSRCLKIKYCSTQCSIDYWPKHEPYCRPTKRKLKKVNSLSEVD